MRSFNICIEVPPPEIKIELILDSSEITVRPCKLDTVLISSPIPSFDILLSK